MNIRSTTLVLLSAGLLSLAACSENNAAGTGGATPTKDAVDAAKKTADDASKLAPAQVVEKAKGMVSDLTKALGDLKDGQGAKDLMTKFQPIVDQLVGMKNTLTAQKFDMSGLKKAVEDATAKFKDNKEVMGVIQPLLDKLKSLTA